MSQWSRLAEIFEISSSLDGAARERALDESCAGDPDLRARVAKLIEASRLERAASEAFSLADGQGRRFGPYETIRLVARGGMGTVYLARRADGEYDQTVAIKVVSAVFTDDYLTEHFRRERQILATLSHPNIARLLDGGVTADGQPYLVMEFVDGVRLDEYADSHSLSTEARLRLFLAVCDAVDYAHRNLVIHCDLKPSNILVADGVPKLLDFGTSKLTSGSDATTMRAMTPRYASPEQLRGQPVSITSDVFSLGVLLHELLTGASPFGGAARILQDTDVPLPELTKNKLPGDLSNIVRKALRLQPAERYATVQQLGQDISNYLDGRPVTARPQTFAYRSAKFARRNRIAVAAASVAVVALIAGSIVSLDQARRAKRQAQRATRATSFLSKVLTAGDPTRNTASGAAGKLPTVVDIVDRSVEQIDQELGDDPHIAVEVCTTLGYVYYTLASFPKAEALLVKCLRQAEQNALPQQTAMAAARLGQVYFVTGQYAKAEPHLRKAAAYPKRNEIDPFLRVFMLNELAVLINQTNPQSKEIAPLFRESYNVVREHPAKFRPIDRCGYTTNLAWTLIRTGESAEAERLFREAFDIVNGIQPPPLELTGTARGLATLLMMREDYESAHALLKKAVEGASLRVDANHPYILRTRIDQAYADAARGNSARAVPELRELLKIFQTMRPAGHPDLLHPTGRLGQALYLASDCKEAVPTLRQALELLYKQGIRGDFRTAEILGDLGACEQSLGNAAEAARLLQESQQIAAAVLGAQNPYTLRAQKRAGTPR